MNKDPNAPPLMLDDQPTVVLTASLETKGSRPELRLAHGEVNLAEHAERVRNQLRTHEAFDLRIPDFVQDGRRFRITALTVRADGSLEPWPRTEDDCECLTLTAPPEGEPDREVSYVVLAVDVASGEVHGDHYPGVLIPPMRASTD